MNYFLILAEVAGLEVVQQVSPARHELQEAALGGVVLLILCQMAAQFVDVTRQGADLGLRAAGFYRVCCGRRFSGCGGLCQWFNLSLDFLFEYKFSLFFALCK